MKGSVRIILWFIRALVICIAIVVAGVLFVGRQFGTDQILVAIAVATPISVLGALAMTQFSLLRAGSGRFWPSLLVLLLAGLTLIVGYPLLLTRLTLSSDRALAEIPVTGVFLPLLLSERGGLSERGISEGAEIGERRVGPNRGWFYASSSSGATRLERIYLYRPNRQPRLSFHAQATLEPQAGPQGQVLRLSDSNETIALRAIDDPYRRQLQPDRETAAIIRDVAALNRTLNRALSRGLLFYLLIAGAVCLGGLALGTIVRLTRWGALNWVLLIVILRGLLWLGTAPERLLQAGSGILPSGLTSSLTSGLISGERWYGIVWYGVAAVLIFIGLFIPSYRTRASRRLL